MSAKSILSLDSFTSIRLLRPGHAQYSTCRRDCIWVETCAAFLRNVPLIFIRAVEPRSHPGAAGPAKASR